MAHALDFTSFYSAAGRVWRLSLLLAVISPVHTGSPNTADEDIGVHKWQISLTHIIEYIEHLHNGFRRAVLKEHVANMRRLSWDSDLAQEAVVITTACRVTYVAEKFGFNYAVTAKTDTTPAGEELMEMISHLMFGWTTESRDIFKPCLGDCNNYTQLIWAETTRFGCAMHTCDALKTPSGWLRNIHLFVCLYKNKGNVEGKAPVLYGMAPCSKCQPADVCDEGLCYEEGCVDTYHSPLDCRDWARRGVCEESAAWMRQRCRKSCDMCEEPCVNVREESHCRDFRARSGCFLKRTYAKQYCSKTCDLCSR